jgi:putative ABC transport system substrate-binding protein
MDGLICRIEIAAFAVRERLPTVTGLNVCVRDGLLMSYAHDPIEAFRRAGWYVDRLIKGTAVAALPIELMSRFQLLLNLRTAKAIGLTIPPTLLARADEVIE